jgi:hypothetical protein
MGLALYFHIEKWDYNHSIKPCSVQWSHVIVLIRLAYVAFLRHYLAADW